MSARWLVIWFGVEGRLDSVKGHFDDEALDEDDEEETMEIAGESGGESGESDEPPNMLVAVELELDPAW